MYPDPKSGHPLDPDKNGCIILEVVELKLTQIFPALFFVDFSPRPLTFAADHRVVESVVGSAPLEHPCKFQLYVLARVLLYLVYIIYLYVATTVFSICTQ